MQKATRNAFTQKGFEVQKINQSGIWAYVESSYLNPDFDSACNGYEVGEGEGRIISVAKWIYRCKRLLRKSNHIAVSVDNGEVLEPCYLIEPSSDDRLQDKTLVWLEPLPQLNGYVIIPGGLSHCGEGYGYYGYGSGWESGIGSGLSDCDRLLNCLCVNKNNEGIVTDLLVKKPSGALVTAIRWCGEGYICDFWGPYFIEYQLETSSGERLEGATRWLWGGAGLFITILRTSTWGVVQLKFYTREPSWLTEGKSRAWISVERYPDAPIDPFCVLYPEDIDSLTVGCPGAPTVYFTILPGRCISGSFVLRPFGMRIGGGGGRYTPCCPRPGVLLEGLYIAQYDVTIHRVGTVGGVPLQPIRLTGFSYPSTWHRDSRPFVSLGLNGRGDSIYFRLRCIDNNLFVSVIFSDFGTSCGMHMQPGYDDWELSIEGCPEQPAFYFTAKPGRCMSGWFKVIPYNPD